MELQKAVTELREDRSHCRGVPNDAVLHLASDTLLPGPCHLGTGFGVLAAILTQTFLHLAAAEVNHVSGMTGKEKNLQHSPASLKLLCTHILRALYSTGPCTPRRLLWVWEEQWHQGVRFPPHPSMLPRAEEQLRNVSPFAKGTLMWWHRVGAALPPALTTPKGEERIKGPFLMRCCSSTHLIFADLPVRKPLMTALQL